MTESAVLEREMKKLKAQLDRMERIIREGSAAPTGKDEKPDGVKKEDK